MREVLRLVIRTLGVYAPQIVSLNTMHKDTQERSHIKISDSLTWLTSLHALDRTYDTRSITSKQGGRKYHWRQLIVTQQLAAVDEISLVLCICSRNLYASIQYTDENLPLSRRCYISDARLLFFLPCTESFRSESRYSNIYHEAES